MSKLPRPLLLLARRCVCDSSGGSMPNNDVFLTLMMLAVPRGVL